MKYQKVVFKLIFLQKMFKSQTKGIKIISLLPTIPLLKSEAETTVRSKMIYVSYVFLSTFQSKYPSKVSAMIVLGP